MLRKIKYIDMTTIALAVLLIAVPTLASLGG